MKRLSFFVLLMPITAISFGQVKSADNNLSMSPLFKTKKNKLLMYDGYKTPAHYETLKIDTSMFPINGMPSFKPDITVVVKIHTSTTTVPGQNIPNPLYNPARKLPAEQ